MTPDRGEGAMPLDNRPDFAEFTRAFGRIALLSFGGPAGQIAVMHRILVDEKKWVGEPQFLHALNFCMLLPGPEAQQLAIYVGWMLHRVRGGLVAGTLFVLPGLVAIMALSWVYVLAGNLPAIAGLFFGLKAAVVAIVFQAVVRIGRRALRSRGRTAIAAAAFAALLLLRAPFPLVVLAAGAIGWVTSKSGRPGDEARVVASPGRPRWAVPGMLAAAWLVPVALIAWLAPPSSAFPEIATYFSRMAVLSFGGAYAVLAWVGQTAVDHYHWLAPREMLDGLGLAESTPGPLIMVTQYVGFLAAYRQPGVLPPLLAGTLGGLLTTWVTFVPCFLWVFLGAPHIERLRSHRALAAALAAVSAAVVGVILDLAVWFALHYWFGAVGERQWGLIHLPAPVLGSLDRPALILSLATMAALLRFRIGIPALLAGAAAAGLLTHLLS